MVNPLSPSDDELYQLQKVAESIVLGAGKILLGYRGKAEIIKSKADALDIVTEADEASEKFIIKELQRSFPNDGILSEENDEIKGGSKRRWVVDPLDGTKEYVRGNEWFTINLALEDENNEIIVGTVYVPMFNKTYSAAKGAGAYASGRKLQVSDTPSLKDSIISFLMLRGNLPDEEFQSHWSTLGHVVQQVYRARSLANDINALIYVATGAYQAFVATFAFTKWWDIAPGILLVQEAGGRVTTTKNNLLTEENYKKEGLLASNGKIHNQLLAIIH